MLGKTQWEETLHDLTVECVQECMNKYALPNIYQWLVFKSSPEPENKDEILEAAKQKWITVVNFLEGHSKKQGKKFLFGDEVSYPLVPCHVYMFALVLAAFLEGGLWVTMFVRWKNCAWSSLAPNDTIYGNNLYLKHLPGARAFLQF